MTEDSDMTRTPEQLAEWAEWLEQEHSSELVRTIYYRQKNRQIAAYLRGLLRARHRLSPYRLAAEKGKS